MNTENDVIASSLISPSDGSVQSDLHPFLLDESNDPDPMDEVSYVFSLWNTNGDEHSFDMDSNNVNLSEDLFDNSEYHWFVTSVDMKMKWCILILFISLQMYCQSHLQTFYHSTSKW